MRVAMKAILGLLVTATLILRPLEVSANDGMPLSRLALVDTQAKRVDWRCNQWTVFCFLGTECPLARVYGPRLQQMATQYQDRDVQFVGVDSNLQDSVDEIEAYVAKHAIEFPMIRDADQSVADALAVSRTPEVVVVDREGKIRYQGRIDDQYEPGIAKPQPTRSHLRDAIEALLAGNDVRQAKTNAVGCLIGRIAKKEEPAGSEVEPTFHRDIVPILNEHCVECHRSDEIGPFGLTDYDEVIGWGPMMLEVVDEGRMPPWHADPAIGHFVGERRMSPEARKTLAKWVDAGMPEGDRKSRPQEVSWAEGWQLPTPPDVEFAMRNRPYQVPAEGVVEYQYFVVDPKFTEDRWIRAAQVKPGDASVVHHSIVFVRPPDGSEFNGIGWMGAYVPGQRTVKLPPGHARRVPAGSKLVFQMHYTPNGKATEDVTRVGVWFADPSSVSHEVVSHVAINQDFEIPPNTSDFVVNLSLDDFPKNGRLLGGTPHMHLRGHSFLLTAHHASGQRKPLLSVPRYDFNWQHWYEFSESIDLSEIESLQMKVTFDNSTNNPFNPAPDEYVTWGDQTWEEMAIAFFDIAEPKGESRRKLSRSTPDDIIPSESEIAARVEKLERRADEFIRRFDANQDGVVTPEETPATFRLHGFHLIDRSPYDGQLSRNEVLNLLE
jgi:peroxiredoxin